MPNYCLDSNAVSDFLNGNQKVTQNLIEALKAGNTFSIPVIVYYEVERGLMTSQKYNKLRIFKNLYATAIPLSLDEKAAEKAVEIYVQLHKGKLIEDNDIYIAAISIVNDCTLVTANTRHFQRVEGLTFVNWRE